MFHMLESLLQVNLKVQGRQRLEIRWQLQQSLLAFLRSGPTFYQLPSSAEAKLDCNSICHIS